MSRLKWQTGFAEAARSPYPSESPPEPIGRTVSTSVVHTVGLQYMPMAVERCSRSPRALHHQTVEGRASLAIHGAEARVG